MTEKTTFPALFVDRRKLAENTRLLSRMCATHGVRIAAVTKVYCGLPELARIQAECGVAYIADSRIENLRKMRDIAVPKMLLRLPMLSQAEEVVELADVSLNSEISVIEELSDAAVRRGRVHEIILMVDLGDLREGVWHEDAADFAHRIVGLPGVRLKGIGVNLTCYGGVLPSPANLGRLVEIVEEIDSRYGVALEIVSGGNSSSLRLLFEGGVPGRVNLLRLGESLVLGLETAGGTPIPGAHRDVFTFAAEIVELKEKPSVPVGEIGLDAFGQKPVFEDRGIRRRAILAVGRQDARIDGLVPRDGKAIVLGASSDHMIVDVTDCEHRYAVGDAMEFDLTYGGLLSVATSPYVTKILR